MQSRSGGPRIFAEVQNHAALFRPDHINRVVQPNRCDEEHRQEPRHAPAPAAGQRRLELVLHALNEIFKIGRSTRAAAAGTVRSLTPRPFSSAAWPPATPLILPWHSLCPLCARKGACAHISERASIVH